MATRQALTGVCFVGLQRLTPSDTLDLPEALRLRWLGMAAKIQQRNQLLNAECVRLVKQLAHDGFHSCILKGQSNISGYGLWMKDDGSESEPLGMYRTPGDIDVLLRSMEVDSTGSPTIDAIDLPIRYCQEQARLHGAKPPHVTYHHADLASEGKTEVEAHYRATFLCSPLRNWRLQNWLEENMPFGICDAQLGDCIFPVPPVSYNAVYQLLHIYKHLFESGIGLRQLLDYYFVLRALHVEQGSFADRTESMAQWAEGMGIGVKSNEEVMHQLSRFGLKRFAAAVMYVLQKVFAMPDAYLLCPSDKEEGEFLLHEILQAGNFGKYDDRIKRETPSIPLLMGKKVPGQLWHAWEKLKHNMRLVGHYPEEVMCEPFFRVYHYIWRLLRLWRFE